MLKPSVEQALAFDCGGGVDDAIAQGAKGALVGLLLGPMQATVADQIASALCQQPDFSVDPPVPPGSVPADGACLDASGQCVTVPLGIEARLPLSSLLAPGSGDNGVSVDLLLRAGGSSPNPASGAPWGQLESRPRRRGNRLLRGPPRAPRQRPVWSP